MRCFPGTRRLWTAFLATISLGTLIGVWLYNWDTFTGHSQRPVNGQRYVFGQQEGKAFVVPDKVKVFMTTFLKSSTVDGDRQGGIRKVPQLMSAAASNQFAETLVLLTSLNKSFKGEFQLVFYDLGLTGNESRQISAHPNVKVRAFPFDDFPEIVSDIGNNAWKVVLISMGLREFGSVVWADTSMRLQEQGWPFLKAAADLLTVKGIPISSCSTLTGHSVAASISQETLDYLPSSLPDLQRMAEVQSNCLVLHFTEDVKQRIMKWALLCSFTRECICRRFDQTIFNVLALNYYRFDLGKLTYLTNVTRPERM